MSCSFCRESTQEMSVQYAHNGRALVLISHRWQFVSYIVYVEVYRHGQQLPTGNRHHPRLAWILGLAHSTIF